MIQTSFCFCFYYYYYYLPILIGINIANSGINIIEVAKLLKSHKYAGTYFSDAITPSTLAQSRSKLRSNNGTSKGKQKAAMENVSYPDDGKAN
jgi:hypothetical protein